MWASGFKHAYDVELFAARNRGERPYAKIIDEDYPTKPLVRERMVGWRSGKAMET